MIAIGCLRLSGRTKDAAGVRHGTQDTEPRRYSMDISAFSVSDMSDGARKDTSWAFIPENP